MPQLVSTTLPTAASALAQVTLPVMPYASVPPFTKPSTSKLSSPFQQALLSASLFTFPTSRTNSAH